MSGRISRARLIEILEHDEELVVRLIAEGIIVDEREAMSPRDIDRALVARTLVRELDVNWPGVEVVLSLREQLHATQRQVHQLLSLLQEAAATPPRDG